MSYREECEKLYVENKEMKKCLDLWLYYSNCIFPNGYEEFGFDKYPSEKEVIEYTHKLLDKTNK